MSIRQIILTFLALFLTSFIYSQDSLDIIHYNINLQVNTDSKSISGHTTLSIKANYSTNKIQLYLLGLHIDSILINNHQVKDFTQNEQTFSFPRHLNKNDTIKLTVFYHGHPHSDPQWGGFYFRHGYAYNYGIGMDSNPLSMGRAWFPTDDSFRDKALFDFYITTDKKQKAVCNGLLQDSTIKNDHIIWHWHLDKPIPPYLADIAVGKYKKISWIYHGIDKNIPVQIYIFSYEPDTIIKTFVHLNQVMRIYENLFGPYPWGRIGYIQTPMTGGAMEHATNISLPFYAINGTLEYEDLIYHELSHSWFGDYVTCSTPKDMWLNEGWASYCESLYKQFLYGQKDFENSVLYNHLITLNFAHKEDNGYRAIGNIDLAHTYGSTIYKKGADVVHNLRYQIGDSLFWPAVRHYLKAYAWTNATITDFRTYLQHYTHQNLKNFFDFWIYTPGFPLFSIDSTAITKISSHKYKVIVTIKQRLIGTKKYLRGQRIQIELLSDKKHSTTRQTFCSGRLTIDTFIVNFRPRLVFIDPYDHLLDASTDQYYWVDTAGQYIFDYELMDIKVNQVKTPYFLRVKTNWIAPLQTLIDSSKYLLNSTYYWTIFSTQKNINAHAKLYLSSLMDINFKTLNEKQLKGLKVFYRPSSRNKWQIIDSQLSSDEQYMMISSPRPGDYIIGYDRTYKTN